MSALDERVAVEVMGWAAVAMPRGTPAWKIPDGGWIEKSAFRPSERIEWAWMVVTECGGPLTFSVTPSGCEYYVEFRLTTYDGDVIEGEAYSEDICVAICEAALAFKASEASLPHRGGAS